MYFIFHECELTGIWLTYDDVWLAGGSTGICCKVALNLVSSLIKQVQVVLHWIAVMEALTQTDDT